MSCQFEGSDYKFEKEIVRVVELDQLEELLLALMAAIFDIVSIIFLGGNSFQVTAVCARSIGGEGTRMDHLSPGGTYTLSTAVAYALPNVAVYVIGQGAGTLQVSNDNVTYASMSTTGIPIASTYIRSTGGTNIVSVKRA